MNPREPDIGIGDLSQDADTKPFRLLSLYDSEEASREASHAANLILRELGESIVTDKASWNLRSFVTNSLRDRAAAEATRADVIVIALSGDQPTNMIKKWAGQWQCSRQLEGGLIALIPSGDSETGADLANFLSETAVTANMDFLCRKKRRF